MAGGQQPIAKPVDAGTVKTGTEMKPTAAGTVKSHGLLVNRAGESKSPYVRSHRSNPVAWQLWDTDAIALAKKYNRLIFLSIGYSACHWCHVMARESFSCDEVAAILNKSFIPIKLDREERPDVDDVYMNYVEATNGTGGWPLNVFLTPDLEPVFGGTYWPSPDSASNLATVVPTKEEIPMISFIEILEKLKDVWETQQWRCRESARGITQQLKEFAEEGTHSTPVKDEQKGEILDKTEVTTRDLDIDLLEEAYQNFAARFDTLHGGFGLEPKFPMPSNLSFLLRLARCPSTTPVADVVGYEECKHATQMVLQTLIAMARGGIHDHLGHGFARYSITADWGLPHFEKMLSDQAQLLDVYLDAFEATRHPELLGAVYDLIAYLTSPPILSPQTNAFYCSEDADSLPARPDSSSSNHSDEEDALNHKHEGAFYTWTLREFANILGTRDAEVCARYWGVRADGNIPRGHDPADEFLNQNVLSVQYTPSSLAKDFGLSEDEVLKMIKHARKLLDDHRRTRRVPPDVDDKIVAGWNGLAIHALAKASIVLSDIDEACSRACLKVAERCMQFVRREMVDQESGQVWRVWRNGSRAKTPGFAEDYAYLAHAAISEHPARMLLEEDPATLIHHTIGNFNIQPDKLAITRINDSLSSLQQSRDLRIRDAEISLRKLSRTLKTLDAQHEELVSMHDPAKHASSMVELDTQKFRLAKVASDYEIESERLEAELEALKARLAELEEQGVEGDETVRREREANDATVLRLKIYRCLGIDAEADENGNYNKAVVRDSRKGDVHVVNIDPKFSRFFYANYFWQTMQG
ncbi:hypothetical protein KEM56_000468 [Ascosphaera pollenicola]|nr:hypothetical protein KEM56_000468 [Ascosphaera pollenicola]